MSHDPSYTDLDLDATRRRMLKLVGGGSVVPIAGCGQGDQTPTGEGDTPTEGGGGGDETATEETTTSGDGSIGTVDRMFRASTTLVPTDLHVSQYNPKSYGKTFARYLYDQPALYVSQLGTWVPVALEDWSVEGDTMTMNIQPDQTWSNGDPLTAEDFRVKWDIQNVVEGTLGNIPSYHQDWQVVDDKTFEISFDSNVNPDIAKADLFTRKFLIDTPRAQWSEFAQKARDATTEDERSNVKEEVTGFTPGLSEAVTNGPLVVDSVSNRGARLAVREDGHPAIDPDYSPVDDSDDWWLNFDAYDFQKLQEGAITLQALLSDELDRGGGGGLSLQQRVLEDPPDHVRAVETPGDFDGVGLAPDHTHEWFGKRKVRQALAYAVDGAKIAESFNPLVNEKSKFMCGVFNGDYERFLPNIHDSLNPYEQSQDQVDALLREAGLEKSDGLWTKPDGETLDTTVISPPWTAWAQAALSLVKQLQTAGFDAKLSTISATNWFSRWRQRDYILTITVWGDLWLPFRNFQSSYEQFSNAPPKMEAPMPPGNPDGEVREVAVNDAMEELVSASGDRAVELNERLAWVWNQSLPILNYTQNTGLAFVNDERFDWPEKDHWAWTVSFQGFNHPKLGFPRASE